MIHKLFFAGIDGSGKSTCSDLLILRLESKYKVLKIINRDASVVFNGNRFIVFNRCYKVLGEIRNISIKYRVYGVFLILKSIYFLLVSKYIEHYINTDLIIYEIDKLLHPSVYVIYHFPLTRLINLKWRFRIARMLFGSKKNFSIFYLDTDPEVAMQRICERGSDVQAHENIQDLGKLKQEFDNMIEIALKHGFEIFRINTNNKNEEEVADEIQSVLKNRIPELNL